MKKKYIVIVVVAVVLFLVVGTTLSVLSKKKVSFDLPEGNYSVVVSTDKGKKVKELQESTVITLKKGNYIYSIIGDAYKPKTSSFTVDVAKTISIHPEYRPSHISEITADAQSSIAAVLEKKYPSVGDITIEDVAVSPDIQWAYGTLTLNGSPTDLYRFIVKRSNNKWSPVVTPAIVIPKSALKDVPETILYDLYKGV